MPRATLFLFMLYSLSAQQHRDLKREPAAPPPPAVQQRRDLKREPASPAAETLGPAKRWALIVGVSSYRNAPPAAQLRYAHRDAEEFAFFLHSPAGGSLPFSQIRLLTNEQATLAAIRAQLNVWLPLSASANDIVYVFFAGHGVVAERDEPYFVAHDSDPQNLHATALPFREVNDALTSRMKAAQVIFIADACHAGSIGWTASMASAPATTSTFLERIGEGDRSILKLLASRPSERSFEDGRWNGGHGVFTYALLEGLRGKAEQDHDGVIRASELADYLARAVPEETGNQQHPRVAGSFEPRLPLSAFNAKVSALDPPAPVPEVVARLDGAPSVTGPDGAWDLYQKLAPQVSSQADRAALDARIQSLLEEQGQQCVSDYVQSTNLGLKRVMLQNSVEAYRRLRTLRPTDKNWEARYYFCDGRLAVAESRFQEAVTNLKAALQVDPQFACAWNALGVAYDRLNRGKESRAAFEEAARLTPEWSLPFLQIAKQYIVKSDFKHAQPYLDKAVRYNPRSVDCRWALTRVDRFLRRYDDAEKEGLALVRLNPNYAPAYLELGQVYESTGKFEKAAQAYDAYFVLAPNYADSTAVKALADRYRKK